MSLEGASTSVPATASPDITVWMQNSWSLCWAGCRATCCLCWVSPSSSGAASSEAGDAAQSGQQWAPAPLPTWLWSPHLPKVLPNFRQSAGVPAIKEQTCRCPSSTLDISLEAVGARTRDASVQSRVAVLFMDHRCHNATAVLLCSVHVSLYTYTRCSGYQLLLIKLFLWRPECWSSQSFCFKKTVPKAMCRM